MPSYDNKRVTPDWLRAMMTLPGGTYPEGTPLTEDGMFAELEEEEEEEQQQQEEEEVEVRTPIMEDVNRSLLHVSSATSLNAMGDRYDRGNGGVQQDRVRALESWVKAASFNCHRAQFSCGQAYALGTDHPQDVPLGMQYLRAAAAQGHDDAIQVIHTMVNEQRACEACGNRKVCQKCPCVVSNAGVGAPCVPAQARVSRCGGAARCQTGAEG